MKKSLIIIFLFFQHFTYAQGENNFWFFGLGAGLDFSSGSPQFVNGSPINQNEGSATVSDSAGNLLFYTDGVRVWNKTHQVMPNGTGLKGGFSSTSSATIAHVPGSQNEYYIFTCPEYGNYDYFYYNIVDMTQNGGNGDVTVKNVPLFNNSSEKCVIIEKDSVSFWVIGHDTMSVFYSYLISPGSIAMPVISTLSVGADYRVGYMKASPQGDMIGAALWNVFSTDTFAVYSFDCSTGVVSNEIKILAGTSSNNTYGLEFSPSGKYLYVITWGATTQILQYDVSVLSLSSITASRTVVATTNVSYMGGAQIGPDNKIYCTINGSDSLAVINNPDNPGASCGFVINGAYLGSGISQIGLPAKIHGSRCFGSTVTAAFSASDLSICLDECISFTNNSTGATSYQWFFTGSYPDTSTSINPSSICFDSVGDFDVTLVAFDGVSYDTTTLYQYIHVDTAARPSFYAVNDTLICTQQNYATYQWLELGVPIPGATNYFYLAPYDGGYSLQVTDSNGCTAISTVLDIDVGVGVVTNENNLTMGYFNNSLIIKSAEYTDSPFAISIYSADGKLVYKNETFRLNKNISISINLSSGIYVGWCNINGIISKHKFAVK